MEKKRIPVIAIFDVGKTNKKLFLFNERYQLVFERSARFLETIDEDGDPCENLESLRLSVFDALHEVFRKDEFDIKAINFASYGASLVYLDPHGRPLTPLYNYLKTYPDRLAAKLYDQYAGAKQFSLTTASPNLGSLNSGLQLYRIVEERAELFEHIKYAVHLPQYLSFLVSGQLYSDMTSIGCHTALWDFVKKDYHQWVVDKGIVEKLPPLVRGDVVFPAAYPGATYKVGVGLHDSSSALIPYLLNFKDPFILISTGTWCISFNPFNDAPLSEEELQQDCLFYLTYSGTAVKASRLFAGHMHELQVKRISDYFSVSSAMFRSMRIDWSIVQALRKDLSVKGSSLDVFAERALSDFENATIAYHALMMDLVAAQVASTLLVMGEQVVGRIFVDGGFSKNDIYMNLISDSLQDVEVYAASMAQATAIGAALVIHEEWNTLDIPHDIIELRYYRQG